MATPASTSRRNQHLRIALTIVALAGMGFHGDACLCGSARPPPAPPPDQSAEPAPAATTTPAQ